MKVKIFNLLANVVFLSAVLNVAGTASSFWLHNDEAPEELLKK